MDATDFRILDNKVDGLAESLRKATATLEKVSDSLGKLSLIEERQTADRAAQERAFKAIELIDTRVKALEAVSPINALTSGAVGKLALAVIAAVVGAMLSTVIGQNRQPAVMIQQAPPQQIQPQPGARPQSFILPPDAASKDKV